MPKLPVVSGATAIGVFQRLGWRVDRQRGSHVTLVRPGSRMILSIPLHRELDRGLIRNQIRVAGLTVGQFCEALGES